MDTHVYIICYGPNDGESGPIKIGMAKDPIKRLSSLQSGNPNKLVIWRTFPMPDRDIARSVERAFHVVKRADRIFGEWFNFTPRVAECLMHSNIKSAMRSYGMDADLIEDSIAWINRRAIFGERWA